MLIGLDDIQDAASFGEKRPLAGNIVVARVVLATAEDPEALRERVRKACVAVLAPLQVSVKVLVATPISTRRG